MTEWEYRKFDLNQQRPRSDELDMLNAAGAEGWELISITSNHIAYLRREVEEPSSPPIAYGNATPLSHNTSATGNGEREARAQGVKPKYRDPKTNETWSGRGRMASWLKSKQDAGENIEKYLI